jgi:hypothetical protein
MATIVVEDGTGLTTSNSYVSAAELSTYATDRGVTITGVSAELLIKAADYLEQQPFQGDKSTDAQAMQWPRYNVWLYGYEVAVTTIPTLLKDAQCELALGIDAGYNPLATIQRGKQAVSVGPLSVTYDPLGRELAYLSAAQHKLKPLLKSGGGMSGVVIRG